MKNVIKAGNKLYSRCGYCGSLVCLNKPILGSLHICLTDEERDEMDRRRKR